MDVLLASLSLMYAIDRAATARECARVLRPGGRFVAAVWAGPEQCDIVRFQALAGQVLKLLQERQLAERLKAEGAERARRFSWDDHVRALLRLVDELSAK